MDSFLSDLAKGVTEVAHFAEAVIDGIEATANEVKTQVVEGTEAAVNEVETQVAEGAKLVSENLQAVKNFMDIPGRWAVARAELQALESLRSSCGDSFPGSDYRPGDRKEWMKGLDPNKVHLNQVVWPGSHDSATNGIGGPFHFVIGPFAECQTVSIYEQLVMGCRVLDVRVKEDRNVCHGPVSNYHVDVVLEDVLKFLYETDSEVIILEIRTEHGQNDPPGFAQFLVNRLGDHLIPQDDGVFDRTIAQLDGKQRVICVWKPLSPAPNTGGLLWSKQYLKDDWIGTDMPKKKFDHNLTQLSRSDIPPVSERKYLYRVENTATAVGDNLLSLDVPSVTMRIHSFARLLISQVCKKGHGNKLQVFSTDFINEDFVDACAAFTKARIEDSPGT